MCGAIQYSLLVIVFVSFSSLPTMLTRGFRGYTSMTNPQVPYRVILTGLCQGVFRVEAVRGLQHLLTYRFVCNSIIKGWKLGWVRCRVYFGLIWTSYCKKLQHNTVQRISKEVFTSVLLFSSLGCSASGRHDAATCLNRSLGVITRARLIWDFQYQYQSGIGTTISANIDQTCHVGPSQVRCFLRSRM